MNILDKIFATKRDSLREKVGKISLAEMQARAKDMAPPRDFMGALANASGLALIAEVKKASPSKGIIRENFDPVEVARDYHHAGAHCLSVLTDVEFFQGNPTYIHQVKSAVPLPVLRKDFTVDAYDVYEARTLGADAILLIVNGLSDSQLSEYRDLAESLGMAALIEAHNEEEANRALAAGAKLLGVNNRDLETFKTTVEVGKRVLPQYTGRAYLVGESAMSTRADVEAMEQAGAQAVLIGSAFCAAPDVSAKVLELMGWSAAK